jgi:hypothetical protein
VWFSKPWRAGWKWLWQGFITQKLLGINRDVPWSVSHRNIVVGLPENISFNMNDINNFQTMGVYFQAFGKITIGEGTYIAPNVGLITQNHDIYDIALRGELKEMVIWEKCWIGIHLGNHTIVGAGSVVTKSYPEGNVILGGTPAKILKNIGYKNKKGIHE